MAGRLTLSTLNNDTGVLATQNGMTGIAKAWVYFNGLGAATVNGSFNISSVTFVSTGNYTVNMTTAMPNANYCICACNSGSFGANWGIINAIFTFDFGFKLEIRAQDEIPVLVALGNFP